jgi:SAM-dependent methyltransferase
VQPAGNWWESFFSGLFVEIWRAAMPPETTRREADFLESQLALVPGANLLDVPCGDGRLALELASRGYRMTGVDLSKDFLRAAREAAAGRGLLVEWRRSDMRDLPWPRAFDAEFSAGSSFGYFDDAGNAAYLEAVARAVKPGASFLIDSSWVAESVLPDFRERLEMEAGGIHFVAENRYDPSRGRVDNRFTVSRGDEKETRLASHRIYTYREITRMLERAGFLDFRAFGSLEGEPYGLGSPRLLLVARKEA